MPNNKEPPADVIRIVALESPRTNPNGPGGRSTWTKQLETKLNRLNSPTRFEVLYGGILGHGVSDARTVLTGQLQGYRLHIGILYLGWNDLGGVIHQPVCEWKKIPNSVHVLNAFSNRLLSFLILREKLSIWAGRGVGGTYDRNRKTGFCSPEKLEAVRKQAVRSKEAFRKFVLPGLEDYATDLKGLIREGQSRGMKFLYVRQAHLPQANHPVSKYLSIIWDVTDSVIKPLKVPSFDMHAYFQKLGQTNELFKDEHHLTVRGTDKLADGLIIAIRDLGWISAP